VVGEFGFVPLEVVRAVLDTVIRNGITGALLWSLRFHNRDGGFYWHSEPSGGGVYKAYHFPGFASGAAYEERELLDLVRQKAWEIRGAPAPDVEPPSAAVMLPIRSPAEIAWRGAAGAASYDVERAESPDRPWSLVGSGVDDARIQYRSLFADEFAIPGARYYYRVVAKNEGGSSPPSNVAGPVTANGRVLVDELFDLRATFAHAATARIVTDGARAYKEDASRLAGAPGTWVVYRSASPIRTLDVYAFGDRAENLLRFEISTDGREYRAIDVRATPFPTAVNPYGYKLPVHFGAASFPRDARFVKIVFSSEAQIGRVAIASEGTSTP
jgi:hypothetical protein